MAAALWLAENPGFDTLDEHAIATLLELWLAENPGFDTLAPLAGDRKEGYGLPRIPASIHFQGSSLGTPGGYGLPRIPASIHWIAVMLQLS